MYDTATQSCATTAKGYIGGGLCDIPPVQKPFLTVNFTNTGDLSFGLVALKHLVTQLEQEIEASFGHQSGGDFRSYSRNFNTTDRYENFSFGA